MKKYFAAAILIMAFVTGSETAYAGQFVSYEIPEKYEDSGGDFPEEIQKFAFLQCEEKEVPYSLIIAMIEVESGYQNDVVSSCGAVGYMQIIEKWHKEELRSNGYDTARKPEANIAVGIDIMASLLSTYDTEQALVIYNAGFSALKDGTKSTPYSREVLRRQKELEKEMSV